jgi:hypothetical protein
MIFGWLNLNLWVIVHLIIIKILYKDKNDKIVFEYVISNIKWRDNDLINYDQLPASWNQHLNFLYFKKTHYHQYSIINHNTII